MRIRTAAVSAALVLCATAGVAACSASSDTADATRPATSATPVSVDDTAGYIETGERRAGPPETDGRVGAGHAACETSAAAIPAECGLDLSFHDIAEGEPAAGPPAR